MKQYVDISALQDRHLDLMIRLSFDMDDADEVQRLLDSPDPVLTPEEQVMAQAIFATAQDKAKQYSRAEKRVKARRTSGRIVMRVIEAAACLILFAMIAVPVAMAASPTFRARVMKLLIVMNPDTQEVQYTLVEDPDAAFFVPEFWPGDFFPSYIPEGYELVNYMPELWSCEFINGDSKFYYDEMSIYASLGMLAEGQIVYETTINGARAIMVESGSPTDDDGHWSYNILWEGEDRWFSVKSFDMSKEETYCIARSVRATGLDHYSFTVNKDAPIAPPYGWQGGWYPTWLPDGWYLAEYPFIPGSFVIFGNDAGEELWFSDSSGMYAEESLLAVSEIIDIHGYTAYVYEDGMDCYNPQEQGVLWNGESTSTRLYSQTLPLEDILRVARSMKPCNPEEDTGLPRQQHELLRWPFSNREWLLRMWQGSCYPEWLPGEFYHMMGNIEYVEDYFFDGLNRYVRYTELPDPPEIKGYVQIDLDGKVGFIRTEMVYGGKQALQVTIIWEGDTCWHRVITINLTEEEALRVAQSVTPVPEGGAAP